MARETEPVIADEVNDVNGAWNTADSSELMSGVQANVRPPMKSKVALKSVNNMKTILIILMIDSTLAARADVALTNRPAKTSDSLIANYDLNKNGKIDVNERKPYIQELSRQRREEAKTFTAQQPVLSPQERQFYHPPQMTPELIQQYDANHNGKIDLDERLKISQAAADAAKAEFRRFDANQDGKLDKEEMKTVQQSKQSEREKLLQPSSQSPTNSPPRMP